MTDLSPQESADVALSLEFEAAVEARIAKGILKAFNTAYMPNDVMTLSEKAIEHIVRMEETSDHDRDYAKLISETAHEYVAQCMVKFVDDRLKQLINSGSLRIDPHIVNTTY